MNGGRIKVLGENVELWNLLSDKEVREFKKWFFGTSDTKTTLLWGKDGGGVFNE
jgi:hypothetical protein